MYHASSFTPYYELHCHSNFSFLDGASSPERLVEVAISLEIEGLALTDHFGLYGAVRFAREARGNLKTAFGTEITFGSFDRGERAPDPKGEHLVILAKNLRGYKELSAYISQCNLNGVSKNSPRIEKEDFFDFISTSKPEWVILTGCRKNPIVKALEQHGPAAAKKELYKLKDQVDDRNLFVELWDHGNPVDRVRNEALASIALELNLDIVVTNNVHFAEPRDRELYLTISAIRSGNVLEEAEKYIVPSYGAFLRSGYEQKLRFKSFPGVIERTYLLGQECSFDLTSVSPELPSFSVPKGFSEESYLTNLVMSAAVKFYGPKDNEKVKGAYDQLNHELTIINSLGYAGYFLIVWDIVQFCKENQILVQGRGSAANSAVCFVLGITCADAVRLNLLFERFLSPDRDGPPDIDLDIQSDRREEVFQYVFNKYGRRHAAQVANVVTYRGRLARREVLKAFGFKSNLDHAIAELKNYEELDHKKVIAYQKPHEIVEKLKDSPRHLGIHSGGIVLTKEPVDEICPVGWGRISGRSVLQWDKEDCHEMGLIKIDLLGLGILTALSECLRLYEKLYGEKIDLGSLEQEPEVYKMLSNADSLGVFQVESRAQMGTLPRLKPMCFYDLVIEVALIRPGPIQGGSVHPYLRRRAGLEPVEYDHPALEKYLNKTLGVPLFQEQLMRIAVDLAGFSAKEADQLRMAMAAKRSLKRMLELKDKLLKGLGRNGIKGQVAEKIAKQLISFAGYGFPESHSISFAYLVYASAWFKYHFPAIYLAAIINAQPMGFWSLDSLVSDAKRHGVRVIGPHVNFSLYKTTVIEFDHNAVRLGLNVVKNIGSKKAATIERNAPYESIAELYRKSELSTSDVESLAEAGALEGLKGYREAIGRHHRKKAIWDAGYIAKEIINPTLPLGRKVIPSSLINNETDEVFMNLCSMGISLSNHPIPLIRELLLSERNIKKANELIYIKNRSFVRVAGIVTHRQRPGTANGTTFLNLEDETGHINVIFSKGAWVKMGKTCESSNALIVGGILEKAYNSIALNVIAIRVEPLVMLAYPEARDYR